MRRLSQSIRSLQPIYVFVPTRASTTDREAVLSPEDLREGFVELLDSYIERVEAEGGADPELCDHFLQNSQFGLNVFRMGLPGNVTFSTIQWLVDVRDSCTDPAATRESVSAALRGMMASFRDLLSALDATDPESGRDLSRVTPLATRAIGKDGKFIQFTKGIRQNLTNSSTNFNRRRAAYILDRFFCDDLTPVNVESIGEHGDNQHGSDTTCFACHYRLDPLAGFFKDYGATFTNFRDADSIIFDDMTPMDKATYDRAWLASPGSGRKWNIGYIRSLNREDLNDYGTDLNLFRIIREAPEVRKCIVKRMHQYFIAEEQTMDAGFVEYLTEEFVRTSAINSSQAIKELAAKIVLSRAFLEPVREPEVCYDFAPGYVPGESPPCRVSYILEKNCASCSRIRREGNLDLSRWVRAYDGRLSSPRDRRWSSDFARNDASADFQSFEQHGSQGTNAARTPPEPPGKAGALPLGQ